MWQTNVFPNAQRRKLRSFEGFNRKAVIVVCDDEEHARRQKDQQNDYGKTVPESTMYDLKGILTCVMSVIFFSTSVMQFVVNDSCFEELKPPLYS